MAVNGIFGSTANATGASTGFSVGRTSIQTAPKDPITLSDDATKVGLSESEKSKSQGLENALRYLSPLQSVVDTASSATERAGEVLNKALVIAKQIETEVDPRKKASLSTEGAALLDELDEISSATAPNGIPVIGQGAVSYSLSLDKPNDSKGNTITVNLPDIRISKSDLGLSGVTSSALIDSNEESQASIEKAIDTVSTVSTSLNSASSAILDTAEANGVSRASQGQINESEAVELSDKVASAIKESPGLSEANKLDPARVLELLKGPDENDSLTKKSNDELTTTLVAEDLLGDATNLSSG